MFTHINTQLVPRKGNKRFFITPSATLKSSGNKPLNWHVYRFVKYQHPLFPVDFRHRDTHIDTQEIYIYTYTNKIFIAFQKQNLNNSKQMNKGTAVER